MKENKYTTIRILKTTRAQLGKIGTKDDDFDAILLKLIEAWKQK